ncbi:MAG: 1-acyl-sn-glycerol-3-phosphate acyltransferase [Ignavibacteriales bacterium]
MNIIFDVDGVIYDIEAFMFKHAVDHFKTNYNLDVVNENGYGVKEIFDCTDEQESEFWIKHAIKYFLEYKPRADIVEAINKLRSEGHNVQLFTSKRCSETKSKRIAVDVLFKMGLKLHNVEVDGIHVFFTDEKDSENSYDVQKLEYLQNNPADVVIEDKKGNVMEFSRIPGLKVLCMATRNNRSTKGDNITTIYNGNDLYTEIKKIEDKKNNTASIFSTFVRLGKEEKMQLSPAELKEYYEELKKLCLGLPFDADKIKKGEIYLRLISATYGQILKRKYNPLVIGKELIPQEKGIHIVSNHRCDKDFKLILSSLQGVSWHPLIKVEILEHKAGILFESIKSIPVVREDPISCKNATMEMMKYLLHDFNVLSFPEGTYTTNITKDILAPFKGNSAAYLAQVLDRYLVPMAITDTYGEGERPIVRIGEPMKVSIDENIDDANNRLWNTVHDLVEQNNQLVKTLKR